MKLILSTLVLFNVILNSLCENILVISFFSSKSHKNVYEPLLYELAQRGHNLTIVSPYKSSKPHKNYHEIIGTDFNSLNSAKNMFEMRLNQEPFDPRVMVPILGELCDQYYEMPEVIGLLNQKFDLIFASYFWNECTYGLIHKLAAPFILFHPAAPFTSSYSANGNPLPLSIIPSIFLGYDQVMSFTERFVNAVASVGFYAVDELTRIPAMEAVYKKHLGEDLPSVHEIERNVSLILSNSHFSIHSPRPRLPDYIEVAGMHCRPAQALPKDLKDFIEGSGEHGVIYFSMGSVVQAHMMPEKQRKALVNAFAQLKQRVIWKWETETMPDLPKNVKLGKWLPQQDILAHPKIRAFITHGGLMSTEEAVYHGVPLIGIPIFGDQDWNMQHSETRGFARTLELTDLTEESILEAINDILTDPKYRIKVKAMSAVFKDQPEKPLDTALFWTEYVMRHKGASHLRSPARDLNFFQYYCLDVTAVLITILSAILFILYKSIRLCVRVSCGTRSSTSEKKKKN